MTKCLKTILLLYFINFWLEMVKSEDVEEQEENKILEDTAVKPEEFPFLATILNEGGEFLCSGSILSPIKVLTAAHCLVRNKAKYAVVGAVDTKTKGQKRRITKCTMHPKYIRYARTFKKRNRGNDLGMVQSQEPPFYIKYPGWLKLAKDMEKKGAVVVVEDKVNVTINQYYTMARRRSGGARKRKCIGDGRAHCSTYEIRYKRTGLNEDCPIIVSRAKDPDEVVCGWDSGGPLVTKDPPCRLIGVHCESKGMESYEVSTVVDENRKWILSQLRDKSKVSSRRNGQKGI